MTNEEKLAAIREAMPVTLNTAYLNTGTAGPLSTTLIDTLNRENAIELAEGRAGKKGFESILAAGVALRERIADLVQADPSEIALTHHTTDGMNIVTHGFDWRPGDEIVTTTLEHQGGFLPLFVVRQRYGVQLKVIDLNENDSPDDMVAKLEAAITPRTRLLVYSHVAWNTGQRLPLAKIAAMGHRYHVPSLVDAAQSIGAIPLDLPASGVDFYAMPGQKWLCGPEGTGALYVRKESLGMLSPTFAGYLSMEMGSKLDFTGYFMPAQGARRFEVGSIYRPGIKALLANLTWLDEEIGWEWIHNRIGYLAAYAREALLAIPGVSIITPPGEQAGLVSFGLDGYDPARVTLKLAEDNIVIRYLPYPYVLRVSTGFYNSEADLDRLVSASKDILSSDPDSLPELPIP